MDFWERLDELKKDVFYYFILTFVISFFSIYMFAENIVSVLVKVLDVQVYSLTPFDVINTYVSVAILGSVIVSSYVLIVLIRNYLGSEIYVPLKYVNRAYLLFAGGFGISIVTISPLLLKIISSSSAIPILWSIDSVISTALFVSVVFGVSATLILIIPALIKMNVIQKSLYYNNRLYIIIGLLVAGAVMTPSNDAISLMICVSPIIGSTELGFAIAKENRW